MGQVPKGGLSGWGKRKGVIGGAGLCRWEAEELDWWESLCLHFGWGGLLILLTRLFEREEWCRWCRLYRRSLDPWLVKERYWDQDFRKKLHHILLRCERKALKVNSKLTPKRLVEMCELGMKLVANRVCETINVKLKWQSEKFSACVIIDSVFYLIYSSDICL